MDNFIYLFIFLMISIGAFMLFSFKTEIEIELDIQKKLKISSDLKKFMIGISSFYILFICIMINLMIKAPILL